MSLVVDFFVQVQRSGSHLSRRGHHDCCRVLLLAIKPCSLWLLGRRLLLRHHVYFFSVNLICLRIVLVRRGTLLVGGELGLVLIWFLNFLNSLILLVNIHLL